MDTYSFLRELADSWVLLAMTIFYITACIWAFSPWRRKANAEAAGIPFRNDAPQVEETALTEDAPSSSCSGNCETCIAAKLKDGAFNV